MLERRPAVKIERVGAKVSGVETSRYNEMNTESRVRGHPYSAQAPRGPQIACTVNSPFSNNGVILRAGGGGVKKYLKTVCTLYGRPTPWPSRIKIFGE